MVKPRTITMMTAKPMIENPPPAVPPPPENPPPPPENPPPPPPPPPKPEVPPPAPASAVAGRVRARARREIRRRRIRELDAIRGGGDPGMKSGPQQLLAPRPVAVAPEGPAVGLPAL